MQRVVDAGQEPLIQAFVPGLPGDNQLSAATIERRSLRDVFGVHPPEDHQLIILPSDRTPYSAEHLEQIARVLKSFDLTPSIEHKGNTPHIVVEVGLSKVDAVTSALPPLDGLSIAIEPLANFTCPAFFLHIDNQVVHSVIAPAESRLTSWLHFNRHVVHHAEEIQAGYIHAQAEKIRESGGRVPVNQMPSVESLVLQFMGDRLKKLEIAGHLMPTEGSRIIRFDSDVSALKKIHTLREDPHLSEWLEQVTIRGVVT